MKDFEVRLAKDEEGPMIASLAEVCGFYVPQMDWSKVYPYWLTAWRGETLLAAIQVCPGLPIARVEILVHRPDLEPFERSRIVGEILETALVVASKSGAKFVSGIVPFNMKNYKRVLKKRGAVTFESGHILYMAV